MEEKDVERAKEAMRRFDPQLVAIAMLDMDIKAESVDSAKEAIGKVYESIDAELSQEKMKVFSKAMSEVGKDVVSMEVENIAINQAIKPSVFAMPDSATWKGK